MSATLPEPPSGYRTSNLVARSFVPHASRTPANPPAGESGRSRGHRRAEFEAVCLLAGILGILVVLSITFGSGPLI